MRGIERVLGSPIERRVLAGFDYGSTPPRRDVPKLPRDGQWTPRGVSVPAAARPTRPSHSNTSRGGGRSFGRR